MLHWPLSTVRAAAAAEALQVSSVPVSLPGPWSYPPPTPRGLCPSTFQLEPPLLPPLSTYTFQIVQADRAGVFRGVLGAWTQQRCEGKKGAVKGGCTCQGRLPGGGLPRCPPVSPSFPVMAILVLLTRHFDHILPSCQIIS